MISWLLTAALLVVLWVSYPIIRISHALILGYVSLLQQGRTPDQIVAAVDDERLICRVTDHRISMMAGIYSYMVEWPGFKLLLLFLPRWLEVFMFWPLYLEKGLSHIQFFLDLVEESTRPWSMK